MPAAVRNDCLLISGTCVQCSNTSRPRSQRGSNQPLHAGTLECGVAGAGTERAAWPLHHALPKPASPPQGARAVLECPQGHGAHVQVPVLLPLRPRHWVYLQLLPVREMAVLALPRQVVAAHAVLQMQTGRRG